PHAGHALARVCARLAVRDGRPLALIVGMLGRKDAEGFFEPFASLAPKVFATSFQSPGAAPPEGLAAAARSAGLIAEPVEGIEPAVDRALAAGGGAPRVLVCGSLHFIGEILEMSPETWPT
ncbi:MAG: bifunctional folylpolyglutamate synthase/dihydrofolate synthase, partial [Caulobacteraceae bacterium]|nr:bifunctional folylpolyglutamate synthase/dihydrofolate synthase [Caulobacteraceae bacterium]